MAKAGGNYLSSTLISTEAKRLGFDEELHSHQAAKYLRVLERTYSLFKDDVIYTPPASSGILTGITRDTVVKISKDVGLNLKEERK